MKLITRPKIFGTLLCVVLLNFIITKPIVAQTCIQPFTVNAWFNQASAVRISPDASRFFVVGTSSAPSGNSSNSAVLGMQPYYIYVYTMGANGVAYKNTAYYLNTFSDFTANNGFFTSYSNNTIRFVDSNGVVRTPASIPASLTYPPVFSKIVGAPNKMIARVGYSSQAYILDATNPLAVTATAITLPGTFGDFNLTEIAASATDNRIYYSVTETGTSVTAPEYRSKIKACTFTGTAVTGWTDVVLQRGYPNSISVRPTDGAVFVRMDASTYHEPFHGVVIFDKNGSLLTNMNLTDMSIMGNPAANNTEAQAERIIRFDVNGNIYTNLLAVSCNQGGGGQIATGLMRFDPNGNLDLGFLRNEWNSYGQAGDASAYSFDISDAGLIIKCTQPAYSRTSGNYSLDIDHVNTNNEYPDSNRNSIHAYSYLPASVANWGTLPEFSNGPTSNYQNVQFLFNNGKLVRPDMSVNSMTANCGLSTPLTIPISATAAGNIICNNLAFITAPVKGTSSTLVLKVPVNVTTTGYFTPITVSGSGLTLQDPNAYFTTQTTGENDFYLTLNYDGVSDVGTFTINVGNAGSCTVNLGDNTKNNSSVINIWTPDDCNYKITGPTLK